MFSVKVLVFSEPVTFVPEKVVQELMQVINPQYFYAREGYSSHFVCHSVCHFFYFGEGAVFSVETYISTI